ncbi:unnamed protein product [Coccothraustes coccothraustes]
MAPAPLAVEQRCSLLGSRGWVAALRLLRFRGKNGVPGLRRALGVLTVERNASLRMHSTFQGDEDMETSSPRLQEKTQYVSAAIYQNRRAFHSSSRLAPL